MEVIVGDGEKTAGAASGGGMRFDIPPRVMSWLIAGVGTLLGVAGGGAGATALLGGSNGNSELAKSIASHESRIAAVESDTRVMRAEMYGALKRIDEAVARIEKRLDVLGH